MFILFIYSLKFTATAWRKFKLSGTDRGNLSGVIVKMVEVSMFLFLPFLLSLIVLGFSRYP